jgi:hypothetical protein
MPSVKVLAAAVLGCIACLFGGAGAAQGYVWYPQNASVSDTSASSDLRLERYAGTGGWVWDIDCRASVAGTTPSNSSYLTLGLSVTQCYASGSIPATASDPVTTMRLIAATRSSGYASIGLADYPNPSFVFNFYGCTVKVGGVGEPEGFYLWLIPYSTPHPAEWGTRKMPIPVEVTGYIGPNQPCAPTGGKWTIQTTFAATYPYLEIR